MTDKSLSLEELSLEELEVLLQHKQKERTYISGSKKILFSLTFLLTIFFVLEGVSTYRQWKKRKKKKKEGAHRVTTQDRSHYKLAPNSTGVLSGAKFHINSKGFRGPEFELEKKQKRVVCIGDSLTFGWGATDEQSYPAYLASMLFKEEIEVINGGVIGYNTKNLIRRLKEDIFPLEPDLVVCLIGWNNLREYVYGHLRPKPAPSHHWSDHFAITSQIQRMKKKLDRSMKISHKKGVQATLNSTNHEVEKLFPFLPEYRSDLQALLKSCQTKQTEVLFLSVPHFFKEELSEEARFELLDITLGVDLSYKGWIRLMEKMNKIVKEVVGQGRFIEINSKVNQFEDFSDFCHPTPAANKKIAQTLAPFVLERLKRQK